MDSTGEKFLGVVTQWFNDHKSAGLILPSGWFGRPHDNNHRLSKVVFVGNELILTLDKAEEELRLRFINLKSVVSAEADEGGRVKELRFEDFEKLIFERQDYGNTRKMNEVFSSGPVRFISLLGV